MGNGEWGMGNGEWGMGNGEWGMGNGEWGMGNGEWGIVVSGNNQKNQLESAQYGEEMRIPRGKRKMEGKNIYQSVFPEFLELMSSCLVK